VTNAYRFNLTPFAASHLKRVPRVVARATPRRFSPLPLALICLLPLTSTGCASGLEFEAAQTRKLLGVTVRDFPAPQGPAQFDEIPADAAPFAFTAEQRPLCGPEPRASPALARRGAPWQLLAKFGIRLRNPPQVR
jgi:hypothetical protein